MADEGYPVSEDEPQISGYREADSVPRSCMRDEGTRPLGAGLQEEAPNHLKLLWLRARVVSVREKAWQRLCQVRFKETSASKPLLRCRKSKDDTREMK